MAVNSELRAVLLRLLLCQLEAKIAVVGPLHDCLGAGDLYVTAKSLNICEVGTACEQEPELRCADLLVELGVATSCNVELNSIGSWAADFVVERIASGEHFEQLNDGLDRRTSQLRLKGADALVRPCRRTRY